jgi:hypothetical protein
MLFTQFMAQERSKQNLAGLMVINALRAEQVRKSTSKANIWGKSFFSLTQGYMVAVLSMYIYTS